ncbi:MAG: hypothetical protein ABI041_18090 [Bdellovibrionia bacterium]
MSYADLWQGAQTLSKQKSSFGIHTQLYEISESQPAAMMTFAQFDYGRSDLFQTETRVGFSVANFYIGLFSKYQFHATKTWEMALMGGLQFQNYLSVATDLIWSTRWETVELYGSLHLVVPLQAGSFGMGLIPGFDFKLSRWMVIYLEADINIAGYFNAGSLGFRYFI